MLSTYFVSEITPTTVIPASALQFDATRWEKAGEEATKRLRSVPALSRLFDVARQDNQDANSIEKLTSDILSSDPIFQSQEQQRTIIQDSGNALYPFLLSGTNGYTALSPADRRYIHALLSLHKQMRFLLQSYNKQAFQQEQERKARAVMVSPDKVTALAENFPVAMLLLGVVASNGTALPYARRIVSWQFQDPGVLEAIVQTLQQIQRVYQGGRVASLAEQLEPIVQQRLDQSRLEISTDMRCGPRYGNKRCPPNHCCSSSGSCGQGLEYCSAPPPQNPAAPQRQTLSYAHYHGEGVLPAMPPVLGTGL